MTLSLGASASASTLGVAFPDRTTRAGVGVEGGVQAFVGRWSWRRPDETVVVECRFRGLRLVHAYTGVAVVVAGAERTHSTQRIAADVGEPVQALWCGGIAGLRVH